MSEFGEDFWQEHWSGGNAAHSSPVNPYLRALVPRLSAGTALDAGCGVGTEAVWLAENGWDVTAVDISPAAIAEGERRAGATAIDWVAADLTSWEPSDRFDLVFSAYAHASISQVELYRRLARWVRPAGTLLIVAHRHSAHGDHPEHATVTGEDLGGLLDAGVWSDVAVSEEERRMHGGRVLRDLVLTAVRSPES